MFFVVRPDQEELTKIAALVDSGELRPIVADTYPLAQGRTAFEAINGPRRPGKIVLVVRP